MRECNTNQEVLIDGPIYFVARQRQTVIWQKLSQDWLFCLNLIEMNEEAVSDAASPSECGITHWRAGCC